MIIEFLLNLLTHKINVLMSWITIPLTIYRYHLKTEFILLTWNPKHSVLFNCAQVSSSDWRLQCLELCINLLGTCAHCSTEVIQYKLSTFSQHKLITELLVMLSKVFEANNNFDHLDIKSLPLTKQLSSCLIVVVQKRSFPLQVSLLCWIWISCRYIQVVCKSLCLIGQILTTLLQLDVDVSDDLATSGCGLLSRIAESLQLCSLDINWEVRDSCIELIGRMAHNPSKWCSWFLLCFASYSHSVILTVMYYSFRWDGTVSFY